MYEYITGRLTFISPSYVVLDVNGIGYQIAIGNPYRYSSKMEQSVTIYVQQIIREDAHLLYGFETLAEKSCFYVCCPFRELDQKADWRLWQMRTIRD